MRKVDVEKIMALKKAGWETEKIAAEMHMDQESVIQEIIEYAEAEKEKTEEDSDFKSEKSGLKQC